MSGHAIRRSRIGEHEAITLASTELEATLVPGAGLVGCSLRHRGQEMLGQRGGLTAYLAKHSTFGIPLLHPWANRLDGMAYRVAGRAVALDPASPRLHRDGAGLPIHGLLAAHPAWRVERAEVDAAGAHLVAAFDFGDHPDLLLLFPFPHRLEVALTLHDRTLRSTTTVTATGEAPVPIAFGWHPYFVLPGVPRAAWQIDLPARRHLALDARCLPTGAAEDEPAESLALGTRAFDDLYDRIAPGATFALDGGGRRVEVRYETGYPVAVVYAPGGADLVCFEPMTAPTNPFAPLDGGAPLALATRAAPYQATYAVQVT